MSLVKHTVNNNIQLIIKTISNIYNDDISFSDGVNKINELLLLLENYRDKNTSDSYSYSNDTKSLTIKKCYSYCTDDSNQHKIKVDIKTSPNSIYKHVSSNISMVPKSSNESELSSSKPKPSTSKPKSSTSKPKPSSEPGLSNESDPSSSKPGSSNESDLSSSKPEPSTSNLKSSSKSKPLSNEPKPSNESDPSSSKPEPSSSELEPSNESNSSSSKPELSNESKSSNKLSNDKTRKNGRCRSIYTSNFFTNIDDEVQKMFDPNDKIRDILSSINNIINYM